MVDVICCKYTSDANFLENNSPDNVNSSNYFWRLVFSHQLSQFIKSNLLQKHIFSTDGFARFNGFYFNICFDSLS